jgi:hypothetical protein
LGLPQAPARSTLAYANEHRPWQLYEELFQQLLTQWRGLAVQQSAGRRKFRFKHKLISLDATVIDLCRVGAGRELLDQPPHCGLLFAGTHELEQIFTRQALELEQWRSRFHAGQALPGISEEEAATIVHSELVLLCYKLDTLF